MDANLLRDFDHQHGKERQENDEHAVLRGANAFLVVINRNKQLHAASFERWIFIFPLLLERPVKMQHPPLRSEPILSDVALGRQKLAIETRVCPGPGQTYVRRFSDGNKIKSLTSFQIEYEFYIAPEIIGA